MTWARVTTGVPIAPKATGAVLATSATTAARTGSKPSATSITEQIATGAPKPASASRSAPKQKATTSAWMRGSSERRPKERRRTSKCRVRTVIRYTHRALTTIHRMGKTPKAAPWAALDSVWPNGMPYANRATSAAASSPRRAARCAFIRTPPSRTRTTRRGRAATRADRPSEPATGSTSWTYTGASPDSAARDLPRCGKRFLASAEMVVSATTGRQWSCTAL